MNLTLTGFRWRLLCQPTAPAPVSYTHLTLPTKRTYRALKYHELLQDFQYTHTGFATLEEIAQMAGIEKNFVDFKLNILTAKGYQLPAVPELKSNFLKDSMKNCSKSYD